MPGADATCGSCDPHRPAATWGAIVLSGGAGTRLGGADKSAIELDGLTLLERALAATQDAAETLVVGPRAPTSRPVVFTREDPVGAGPAAALLHGAAILGPTCDIVVALAVDMAWVTRHTVDRVLAALVGAPDADAAVLHDGRRQPLCAAYRTGVLLQRAPAPASRPGTSMRALVGPLRLVEVPAAGSEAADVDHWGDLDRPRPS